MKENKILIAIIILFVGYIGYNLYNRFSIVELDTVQVEVDQKVIDIGNVLKSDKSLATFQIKNIGANYIVVDNISTDCHCTAGKWSSDPVGPNESFEVELSYDNNTSGFFEQTAYVNFRKSKSPPLLLVMRGTVVSD